MPDGYCALRGLRQHRLFQVLFAYHGCWFPQPLKFPAVYKNDFAYLCHSPKDAFYEDYRNPTHAFYYGIKKLLRQIYCLALVCGVCLLQLQAELPEM